MSLTYSSMLELESKLPYFNLRNVCNGNNFSSNCLDVQKPSLIMFICNHCPYVIHYHEQIKKINDNYLDSFNLVAISSNDIQNYPQDSPEKMKILWSDLKLDFPYLFDQTQEVAKSFKAECTPEFYIFDCNKKLRYRGRMDETSPGSGVNPHAKDLIEAMDALITGNNVNINQYPSMGCNIKWSL